eukprot:scaffold153929_cov31-Tisochrysis_lutea.AAC.1
MSLGVWRGADPENLALKVICSVVLSQRGAAGDARDKYASNKQSGQDQEQSRVLSRCVMLWEGRTKERERVGAMGAAGGHGGRCIGRGGKRLRPQILGYAPTRSRFPYLYSDIAFSSLPFISPLSPLHSFFFGFRGPALWYTTKERAMRWCCKVTCACVTVDAAV